MGAALGLEPYDLMAQYLGPEDEDSMDEDFNFENEQDDEGTLDRETVESIRRGTSSISDVEAAERL